MTNRPLPWITRLIVDALLPREWRESVAGDLTEERQRRRLADQPAGPVWTTWHAARTALRLATAPRRTVREGAERHAGWTDGLGADLRAALRGFSAHPAYVVTAVLTLALGIGASTSVFALADWLLLRPIPGVVDAGRLTTIRFGRGGGTGLVSMPALDQLVAATPALESLAGWDSTAVNVASPEGGARRLTAGVVTGNFFSVLGGAIAFGRGFSTAEGRDPTLPPVVVVSFAYWQDSLNSSPEALGRPLTINSDHWTIVGIAARGFTGPSRTDAADLWVPVGQFARVLPMMPGTLLTNPRARVFSTLVGRLAPAGTLDQVNAQAEVVRARLAALQPADVQLKNWRFFARPGIEDRPFVQTSLTSSLSLVSGFAGLLILLTVANISNLMLVRATGRRAEIATRLAIGGSRWRIARLLLVESLVVAIAGASVAIGLSAVVERLFSGAVILMSLQPLGQMHPDWRVFAFALGLSTLVAISSSVMPVVAGGRLDVHAALRESGRTHTSTRARVRSGLAAVQVAVSLVLLVGALLLSRSMANRDAISPGFDPARVLAFSVEPRLQQDHGARQAAFYTNLLSRLRTLPGVGTAAIGWLQPFSPNACDVNIVVPSASPARTTTAECNTVSDGFFDTLGLRFIAGRDFQRAELSSADATPDAPIIINAALARTLFGAAPALGRRITLDYRQPVSRTVVGVVADTRQRSILDPPPPMTFEPLVLTTTSWATALVSLSAPAGAVTTAIRQATASIDPTLPIYHVDTLEEEIARQLADEILVARLAGVFAMLATLLSAVGLYGVLARGVAERRREFGIRVALGATPRTIGRLIASEAGIVLAIGVAAGIVLAAWLVRYIGSHLFGVTPADPMSLVGGVLLVAAMAVLSAQPAIRRASALDPAVELRQGS